ncbi:MarR family winged helix-turn-helix transcriptional regulator [Bradyrhizobium sp. WYCCWR 13023]|uniref:MarR family winged helix-turn-helix transcriptional regulator n=1 Tax=Bradyrhizobium zhengyangense TaxID=2911009 RepID=A0A9X1RKB8_9BRAD|nr:MarR family winged helix-turn-helix transcriptional regulator [Bradyrhizobium zhengyangense]MCG2631795.1 MarR family winged helix-turn-helix transcriptional regulator [Bradyrhizobium zhengyangense]
MSHPTLDLKKAYLALRRALDQTLRRFNLTSAQFDVLQLLMHKDGLPHRDLQQQLAIASPTLTNIIDVLEREGHVERRSDGPDARTKTIHLSRKARALCASDELCSAGDALVVQMFRGFSKDQRAEFMNALKRIETNLDGPA